MSDTHEGRGPADSGRGNASPGQSGLGQATAFGPDTLVTVIMPIYAAEETVEDAVRSVLKQTHGHFELIAVDDGSPDRSGDLVAAIDDPRIRLIRKENGGVSTARNTALRAGRGDVVALIDSDDLWEPVKLERHLAHLTARPDVGISYCPSAMMSKDGTPVGLNQIPKLRDLSALDVYCGLAVQNGSSPVFRRAAFDAVAFDGPDGPCYFDEAMPRYEDIECWVRMALTTPWRFEGIDEALTWYRLSPDGLSSNLPKHFEGWTTSYEKIRGYAPDFIEGQGHVARAYALRNFARRAVRARDRDRAWPFAWQALKAWPGLVGKEPAKSLTTLVAAGAVTMLPAGAVAAMEKLALRVKAGRSGS